MNRIGVVIVLAAALATSALQLVLSRHDNRRLFIELQDLRVARDKLDEEWGQLLLEEATWGTHSRVEQIARERLQMQNPRAGDIFGIRL